MSPKRDFQFDLSVIWSGSPKLWWQCQEQQGLTPSMTSLSTRNPTWRFLQRLAAHFKKKWLWSCFPPCQSHKKHCVCVCVRVCACMCVHDQVCDHKSVTLELNQIRTQATELINITFYGLRYRSNLPASSKPQHGFSPCAAKYAHFVVSKSK